ncbi:MAG: hypothetical protein MHM6MM_006171 [Cercozoa sp. M6MM]
MPVVSARFSDEAHVISIEPWMSPADVRSAVREVFVSIAPSQRIVGFAVDADQEFYSLREAVLYPQVLHGVVRVVVEQQRRLLEAQDEASLATHLETVEGRAVLTCVLLNQSEQCVPTFLDKARQNQSSHIAFASLPSDYEAVRYCIGNKVVGELRNPSISELGASVDTARSIHEFYVHELDMLGPSLDTPQPPVLGGSSLSTQEEEEAVVNNAASAPLLQETHSDADSNNDDTRRSSDDQDADAAAIEGSLFLLERIVHELTHPDRGMIKGERAKRLQRLFEERDEKLLALFAEYLQNKQLQPLVESLLSLTLTEDAKADTTPPSDAGHSNERITQVLLQKMVPLLKSWSAHGRCSFGDAQILQELLRQGDRNIVDVIMSTASSEDALCKALVDLARSPRVDPQVRKDVLLRNGMAVADALVDKECITQAQYALLRKLLREESATVLAPLQGFFESGDWLHLVQRLTEELEAIEQKADSELETVSAAAATEC